MFALERELNGEMVKWCTRKVQGPCEDRAKCRKHVGNYMATNESSSCRFDSCSLHSPYDHLKAGDSRNAVLFIV